MMWYDHHSINVRPSPPTHPASGTPATVPGGTRRLLGWFGSGVPAKVPQEFRVVPEPHKLMGGPKDPQAGRQGEGGTSGSAGSRSRSGRRVRRWAPPLGTPSARVAPPPCTEARQANEEVAERVQSAKCARLPGMGHYILGAPPVLDAPYPQDVHPHTPLPFVGDGRAKLTCSAQQIQERAAPCLCQSSNR